MLVAERSIYGFTDAARAWWEQLKAVLQSAGAVMSDVEFAYFYLHDDCGQLIGIILAHVDDLLFAHDGSEAAELFMKNLREQIEFGEEKAATSPGGLEYCGRRYVQSADFSIEV